MLCAFGHVILVGKVFKLQKVTYFFVESSSTVVNTVKRQAFNSTVPANNQGIIGEVCCSNAGATHRELIFLSMSGEIFSVSWLH